MSPLVPRGFGLGGHFETCLKGPISNGAFPQEELNTNEIRMLRALVTSMQGAGITNPNPAVGCLVFRGADLVASGATEAYGGLHAERVAFEILKKNRAIFSDLEFYVTLEPCAHHGRQPPCCELFNSTGISRVYVAAQDPNPLVSGKGLADMTGRGVPIELMQGLAMNAVTAWHLPFLVEHALGRPLIAGKWAQTLDGALADAHGQSKWITGPEARAYGHWLRLKYDMTAIGLNTFLEDQPSLTVRDCWRPSSRQPSICIFDWLGESQPEDPTFLASLKKMTEDSSERKLALVCPQSHARKIEHKMPSHLALLPCDAFVQKEKSPADAMAEFWKTSEFISWFGRQPQSIFVEGGATLLTAFIEAELLDVLHIFVAPKILGNNARRVASSSHTSPNLSMAAHFDILSTYQLGNDMLLELAPKHIVDRFFAQG